MDLNIYEQWQKKTNIHRLSVFSLLECLFNMHGALSSTPGIAKQSKKYTEQHQKSSKNHKYACPLKKN